MKELFRERDFTRVAYFQNLVEAEGISTFIRNQHLTNSGLSEIPIPEFFPALCVLNDEDHPAAVEIIRRSLEENARNADAEEIPCPGCGEPNPQNFELCWSCGKPLTGQDR